jgi:hypothetical protein
MRVLPIVLLVLWVSSAAVAEDAAAQEDTATLWAALFQADPRYVDLRRNVLSKLERAMPRVTVRLATGESPGKRIQAE